MNTTREIVNGSADPRIQDEEIRSCAISTNPGTYRLNIWGPKLMALMLGICAMGATHSATYAATISSGTDTCANKTERLPSLSPTQMIGWPDLATNLPAGSTTVQVDLDTAALVRHVSVAISSGDPVLDWDAMQIASSAKFELGTGDCGGHGGSYLFVVDAN